MPERKTWTVEVVVDEDAQGRRTHAQAALLRPGDGTAVEGEGEARRDPADADVPTIGDQIAVARALVDLARSLLEAAEEEITAITHKRAHVHM